MRTQTSRRKPSDVGEQESVVVTSSAEAEFRVVAHGICELLWLKKLFEDLRIPSEKPMKLYYDNKATINIAHNLVQHDRTSMLK
ncbi:hypothetical protein CK203_060505 [Vitis vinifera]|uniref:Copia protein n=1 Tax=Vitis vinifera TaxID=29760 RepID=A0A438GT82_VITVI|nr:hypothetical protein CK203_060505 [Vitis vinifera]